MTVELILFLISLLGIIFMITRKMVYLRSNQIVLEENIVLETPYIKEIKHITVKKLKEYGYIMIITTLRFSIKSSKYIKEKSSTVYHTIKSKLSKNSSLVDNEISEKQEVSKFLKMVSDYKHKIKKIKHKIREEEGME